MESCFQDGACGLYAVCNFHFMFKVLLTCYTISATKARPLSDPILTGNRNLGTISLSRPRERTYSGQQVMVASGRFHFSEVHSRCSKGSVPFTWIPGGFCLCQEATLTCEQAVQCWDFVLHREVRRGTKKYFQISSSSLLWPRSVARCVWVTRVGASSSVPIICHLAIPTILFQSWWPLLLWLVGFRLQCILESPALAQAAPPIWEL